MMSEGMEELRARLGRRGSSCRFSVASYVPTSSPLSPLALLSFSDGQMQS